MPKVIHACQTYSKFHYSVCLSVFFQLKPYVSYKVSEVKQTEFTAQDLFNACYAKKIVSDYKNGDIPEKELDDVEALLKRAEGPKAA